MNAERLPEYDLVVGWMVLEHLHDPIRALRKLRSWAKPGGWLIVSVPNADCYEFARPVVLSALGQTGRITVWARRVD